MTAALLLDERELFETWVADHPNDYGYLEKLAALAGWQARAALTDETPSKNDMKFCCYCGRQLIELALEDGKRS